MSKLNFTLTFALENLIQNHITHGASVLWRTAALVAAVAF